MKQELVYFFTLGPVLFALCYIVAIVMTEKIEKTLELNGNVIVQSISSIFLSICCAIIFRTWFASDVQLVVVSAIFGMLLSIPIRMLIAIYMKSIRRSPK